MEGADGALRPDGHRDEDPDRRETGTHAGLEQDGRTTAAIATGGAPATGQGHREHRKADDEHGEPEMAGAPDHGGERGGRAGEAGHACSVADLPACMTASASRAVGTSARRAMIVVGTEPSGGTSTMTTHNRPAAPTRAEAAVVPRCEHDPGGQQGPRDRHVDCGDATARSACHGHERPPRPRQARRPYRSPSAEQRVDRGARQVSLGQESGHGRLEHPRVARGLVVTRDEDDVRGAGGPGAEARPPPARTDRAG